MKDSGKTDTASMARNIIITFIIFSLMYFLSPIGFIHVFIGIFSIPVYVIIIILLYIAVSKTTSPYNILEEFKSRVKIMDNYLILPEHCTVEYGYMRLTTIPYQPVSRSRVSITGNIVFENSRVIETQKLDLNDLCNHSFFAYSDLASNAYISAPGFIVKSGKYIDIIGICFNQDTIREKTMDLSIYDLEDSAVARLTI